MNIINICSPEVYGDAQLPHARTHKHVHSFHRMAFLESLTINDFRHPLVHLQPPKLRCKCKSTKFLRVYIDMFSFWVGLFLVINHPISLIFHQITIYIFIYYYLSHFISIMSMCRNFSRPISTSFLGQVA